jgi:hypothetical protein
VGNVKSTSRVNAEAGGTNEAKFVKQTRSAVLGGEGRGEDNRQSTGQRSTTVGKFAVLSPHPHEAF